MEISAAFPFLNQDEISHFWSLLQDTDNTDLKKRKRNDGGGGEYPFETDGKDGNLTKKSAMRELVSTLLMLDDEEKQEQQHWDFEFQQHKAGFDSNYRRTFDVMSEFDSIQQRDSPNSDEIGEKRAKRARRGAAAVEGVDGGGASTSGQQRRLWVKDRSKDWWERLSHPEVPDEEFKKTFRMSRATFNMICDELDSAVTKKNTMLRDAVPVRQRVAVCIWRLATGEPLRLVSKRFGLGISTCHKLVLEVCSAIRNVLMPKFLNWPDGENLRRIKSEFESISSIPNIGGAMYTTHIPIIAPKTSVAAYFNKKLTERNQKTSYSTTVQGVVDHRGVFTDVCIGWPGSLPDDQILEKSALYKRANRGAMKDTWIVGNKAHPLMDWVLVPYSHQNLTWAQHGFNERVGAAQGAAAGAFGRLKGRWGCLQRRTEVKLQDLPVVLGACCVLHNICEIRGEEIEEVFEVVDDELLPENGVRSAAAAQARDGIAHHLLHHHGLVGRSSFL